MTVRSRVFVLLFLVVSAARADWQSVAPGVDYQEFRSDDEDIYVTRVNLANDQIRVVVSRESEKGLKVSDFAKKNHAIAAINGDYFDDKFNPVGVTVGPCGLWVATKDLQREVVLEVTNQLAALRKRNDIGDPVTLVADAAISGWPAIVADCKPLGARDLPGSDAFTRAPHPRTAVGISNDRKRLYFVVADGRRTGVPGLTLAQLAFFMADQLGVCAAVNLDGGGSAAMWVDDRIVNRPSDGVERPVGDAIAVVYRRDYMGCDRLPAQTSPTSQR